MSLIQKKAKTREKVWLRLDRDLLLKARDLAQAEYEDEKKWRAVVEDALSEYFTKKINDIDLTALLSKTEQALFDRLYGKIEHEFDDMVKRTVNRVGNLVAVSSYDTALTAIMVEELFKEKYSSMYYEARKLAAERMKKRWNREGADEVQLMVSEKAEAENEARRLRGQVEQLQQQIQQQEQIIEKAKRMLTEQKVEVSKAKDIRDAYGQVVHWTRGLIEHLENSKSMFTTPNAALDEYKKKHPKPAVL